MTTMENYLHDFLRVLFAHKRLIKRVFLTFALITLLLPLVLKQSFEISSQVIVQSKKLSQSDVGTALTQDSDKFIPPSLADMETEVNILRSTTLVRQTIEQLHDEGQYSPSPGVVGTLLFQPLKRVVVDPLRNHVINPLRSALGLETDSVRDTTLDSWTAQALEDLTVETLPGSNVVFLAYRFPDPAQGTRFVERLLSNYLISRQELQSNDLPLDFYEQKKAQYQERLDHLEARRLTLLGEANASDPTEEITFRLNAINTEEQALNLYRDRALEGHRWITYLQESLTVAREAGLTDYSFPYAFANTVDNIAYEDREIKQLGEQLSEQVSRYGSASETYQQSSLPIREQREQITRTRDQFLRVVENRIRERRADLEVVNAVIEQKVSRIDRYKSRILTLQEVQSKLRQLDTEIDALHKAFFTYTQRYEESRSQGLIDGALSNARILSHPYEPTEAVFPKPMLIISLGLLTGLLLAIALGYVREFFDHRFKLPAQVQQHLGLPVLMVINTVDKSEHNPYTRGSGKWLWHWARA